MSYLLDMDQISKVYPNGTIANQAVSFQVKAGEIHALMGENGAGKSTLMKVLFGLEQADGGTIHFKGQRLELKHPADAIEQGIGMVSQHSMLVDELNIAENLYLGQEQLAGSWFQRQRVRRQARDWLQTLALRAEPDQAVASSSVSQKQKLELLRLLLRQPELIILDEPTAVLTPPEIDSLFEQLRSLKEQGYTIIFISHKVEEVLALADRITVMRHGQRVGIMERAEASAEKITEMMIGQSAAVISKTSEVHSNERMLSIQNLEVKSAQATSAIEEFNLEIKLGEIYGIAGIEKHGQNELVEALIGLRSIRSGQISFQGQFIESYSVAARRRLGLAYVPEDRISTGLAGDLSIWENLLAAQAAMNLSIWQPAELKKAKAKAHQVCQAYAMEYRSVDQAVSSLSGGNMQKLLLARELEANPRLLIAHQPTRGMDLAARDVIWQKLLDLKAAGHSVLLVSADLDELLALSDRIGVLREGRLVAEFNELNQLDRQEIGCYMLGRKEEQGALQSSTL